MSTYELRINDESRLVESVAALTALVRSGSLGRRDPVSKDGAPPIPAEELPELREVFGVNIWSAWEDLDEEPPAEPPRPAAPEPPKAAAAPEPPKAARPAAEAPKAEPPKTPPKAEPPRVAPPKAAPAAAPKAEPPKAAPAAAPKAEPPAVVAAAPPEPERPANKRLVIVSSRRSAPAEPLPTVEPLALDPKIVDPISDSPRGEVIAFPGPSRPAPRRPAPRLIEPHDDAALLQVRREEAEPERFPPRTFWIGGIAAATLLALGLGLWYLRSVALWTNPAVEPIAEVEPVEAPEVVEPPKPEEPAVAEAQVGEADALLNELRARIPLDAGSIEGTDTEFGDQLFIELQRVVSPRTVDARVMARTRTGVPEVVEFTVRVNNSGDVLRDLAGVALVLGKYTVQYELQVRRIEVVVVDADGAERSRELSPSGCAQLWNGKIKLTDLLLPK